METDHLAAFAAYFFLLLSIGIYSHRAQKNSKDFIVGNRSLNFWVTAFSAHASDMSGWLFMAFPAAVFMGGITHTSIALGLLLGMFLNWQFVAIRLREETEKYECYTLSTYFERKFGDSTGALRTVTALMMVLFITFYLSAGLIAMGFLLESLFDINYYIGLSVAMLVAMIYTMVGGYYTVAKVDQFQALFLLLMIVIVPVAAFNSLPGGIDTIRLAAMERGMTATLSEGASLKSVVTMVLLIAGWGLGYFGQPHIITKFMGIESASELKKAKIVGMTWQLTALAASTAVGVVGIGFFSTGLSNPELVFANMVQLLFSPLVASFILCGVIAANISTMDSQILVCASVLSEDLYKHIFKSHASDRELLIVSRLSVAVVSLVSLFIAFNKSSSVLDAVFYAWSGLGSAFGPLVLLSLWWKGCNRAGAFTGILVGGVSAGLWPSIYAHFSETLPIPAMIPGFLASFLSIVVVSSLTREKNATVEL